MKEEQKFLLDIGIPDVVVNGGDLDRAKQWVYLSEVLKQYKDKLNKSTTQLNLDL